MRTNFTKVFYKIGQYSKAQLEKLYNQLPQSRKERIDKIENAVYREFLIVEFFIVINKLGKSPNEDFLYNDLGKPYFENSPLNFSISHSQNLLIVVFSKYPIGVDLQHFLPFDYNTALDVCNSAELNIILNSKNKDREFTRIWTQKESVVKLHGTTLYLDVKNILNNASDYQFKNYLKKDYSISICIKK